MNTDTIQSLIETFEEIETFEDHALQTDREVEYWLDRDLQFLYDLYRMAKFYGCYYQS